MTDASPAPTVRQDALRTEKSVLVEQRGHVLIVTLNRPAVHNAVDRNMTIELGNALELAENETSVRVVLLTGSGDKSFCAGADLKAASRGELDMSDEKIARWGFAGIVRHHISKPIIAAVNGFALGGGTEIVLHCDLAIASDTATFGLPEVKRGIVAAAGGAFRLPRQLPHKIAMELLLTGQPVSAERALELGLVNHVVPADQLFDRSLNLADTISANAPLAVQSAKRIAIGIADGRVDDEVTDWDRSRQENAALKASRDAREGMVAFTEKRVPQWAGK